MDGIKCNIDPIQYDSQRLDAIQSTKTNSSTRAFTLACYTFEALCNEWIKIIENRSVDTNSIQSTGKIIKNMKIVLDNISLGASLKTSDEFIHQQIALCMYTVFTLNDIKKINKLIKHDLKIQLKINKKFYRSC